MKIENKAKTSLPSFNDWHSLDENQAAADPMAMIIQALQGAAGKKLAANPQQMQQLAKQLGVQLPQAAPPAPAQPGQTPAAPAVPGQTPAAPAVPGQTPAAPAVPGQPPAAQPGVPQR
jgi:hypothetical protein